MSREAPNVTCPRCEANRGNPCRSPSGRLCATHSVRETVAKHVVPCACGLGSHYGDSCAGALRAEVTRLRAALEEIAAEPTTPGVENPRLEHVVGIARAALDVTR